MRAIRKAVGGWRKLSRALRIILIVLVALLIGARLALPHWVERYVNRKLDELPDYTGQVGQVRMHLLRGAYSIRDVNIYRDTGRVPLPFFLADRVDFSVEWRQLFRGSLVSEVHMDRARLNFVQGDTDEDSQLGIDRVWVAVMEDLFPFRINRFELRQSEVWYRDLDARPEVHLFVTNMVLVAANLTNIEEHETEFPGALRLTGVTIGGGDLLAEMRLNLHAPHPTFDLNLEARDMDLTAFNDFLEAYARFDVEQGTLSVFSEIAAKDGQFTGYVRPLAEDIKVVDLTDEEKGFLRQAWEVIIAAVVHIFKNHREDRFGTEIPISGTFDDPEADMWATVVNVLRNTFIEALPAAVGGTITPELVPDSKKQNGSDE
jgi:uncharacterized protein YhdP